MVKQARLKMAPGSRQSSSRHDRLRQQVLEPRRQLAVFDRSGKPVFVIPAIQPPKAKPVEPAQDQTAPPDEQPNDEST